MHLSARLLTVAVGLLPLVASAQSGRAPDEAARVWMQTALANWEFICTEFLRLQAEPLPWMIFYDETNTWHIEADRALVPTARVTGTKLTFAGREREVLHVTNTNGVWMPSRQFLPAGPSAGPRTFAMPYGDGEKCFFIAAIPSFIRSRPGADQSVNWESFSLGLVAHEITHTRQLADVVRRIRKLREQHHVPVGVDDNYLERTYKTNAAYVALFEEERQRLFRAAAEDDKPELGAASRAGGRALAGDGALHTQSRQHLVAGGGICAVCVD